MKIEKAEKLLANLHDKTEYVMHIRNLNQALNHFKFSFERILHRVINFKQKAWLKPYINMNTDQRKKAKNNFEKHFFKLKNIAVF